MASILAISMVALLPLTVMAAPGVTSSSGPPVYHSRLGTGGTGDGQFTWPHGIAIDKDDNVYVADTFNHYMQKFAPDGTFIMKWGSAGDGDDQFTEHYSVTVDSSDNVYVVDLHGLIKKYTANGTFITKWGSDGTGDGQFDYITGIATDSNNNVYVVDTNNNRIQKFTANGTFVAKWGGLTEGSDNGQFSLPYGIAIDSNDNVYVADFGNGRIQKLTADGVFVAKWGSEGYGSDQGIYAQAIAVDGSGNVYAMDTGSCTVTKFTAEGVFATQWGSEGGGNGQFTEPLAIAADSRSNVYVVDSLGYSRIQRFSSPQNLASFTTNDNKGISLTLPQGSNITSSQTLAATEPDQGYVYPLDLVDFTYTTPGGAIGASTNITLVFETELTPADVTARKYNSTTKTYTTIPGAVVTATTLDGNPALQLAYTVVDGSALDDDGEANGVIVDPAGLAVLGDQITPTPTPTPAPTPTSNPNSDSNPTSTPTSTSNEGLPATGATLSHLGPIGALMAGAGISFNLFNRQRTTSAKRQTNPTKLK